MKQIEIMRYRADESLRKIHQAYNPEHDLGPEAPVHWSVERLAQLVGRLVDVIEKQQEDIEALIEDVGALQDGRPAPLR